MWFARFRISGSFHQPFSALIRRSAGALTGVRIGCIRPGKPVENGFIESFNRRWRDECLNLELFWSIEDAKMKLDVFSFLIATPSRRYASCVRSRLTVSASAFLPELAFF
jgi:transposase InsO family protein